MGVEYEVCGLENRTLERIVDTLQFHYLLFTEKGRANVSFTDIRTNVLGKRGGSPILPYKLKSR